MRINLEQLHLDACYLVTFRLLGEEDQNFIGRYKGTRPMLTTPGEGHAFEMGTRLVVLSVGSIMDVRASGSPQHVA